MQVHSKTEFENHFAISASGNNGRVDTRYLKNGMMRLRFKLTSAQEEIVDAAGGSVLIQTGYESQSAALDLIFMGYQAGYLGKYLASPEEGTMVRRLFRLYPDQYESVRAGLDLACDVADCPTDAHALIHVCQLCLA